MSNYYSSGYTDHTSTNSPDYMYNSRTISAEDYVDYPDHLRTEPTINPFSVNEVASSHLNTVPVFVLNEYQDSGDGNAYNPPINSNPTQTINNTHNFQHIRPEEAKSCCTLSAIDIVAICAISLFAVAVVALSLTINPFIAIALVALPIAIPSYIGCRLCCADDDDDDDIGYQTNLMTQIDQANQNAIYQTLSPPDELRPVYTRTNNSYY